jgi:hypothetical protein
MSADEMKDHADAVVQAATDGTLADFDAPDVRCVNCHDYHSGPGRVCDWCLDELDRMARDSSRGWSY